MAKKGFLDGYKTYDAEQGFGNAKKWQQTFKQRMSKDDAFQLLKGEQNSAYDILGIHPGATSNEIKKAYRKKIMEWHTDRNQHRLSEAEEQSRKIIAAYTVLTS